MDGRTALYLGAAGANVAAAIAVILIVLAGTKRRFPHIALTIFLVSAASNAISSTLAETATDPALSRIGAIAAGVTVVYIYAFYAVFVAASLKTTPLTRPFQRWPGQTALVAGATALAVWVLLAPDAHIVEGPAGGALFVKSPLHLQLLNALNIVLLWALAASIDAFRRAPPGSQMRRRAKAYTIAFGIQDALVILGLVLFSSTWTLGPVLGLILVNGGPAIGWFLLARSMIRENLFDADLRIKTGLRRGTVGAFFLGAFFVAAQLAQNYLSTTYGYLVGGVAAGLLLFAFHPLQRAAERFASTAMPRVNDTAEYRTVRKLEVYQAAVESAAEDGVLTDRERNVLATLADELGLSAREALEVERRVARAATTNATS